VGYLHWQPLHYLRWQIKGLCALCHDKADTTHFKICLELKGFIKPSSASRFVATFAVGVPYNFVVWNPLLYLPQGKINLHERKTTQLHPNFDGKLGPNKVWITLSNGPATTGTLDMPINPKSRIAPSLPPVYRVKTLTRTRDLIV